MALSVSLVLLICQGPTVNEDLSASSSSSVEISGLQSEAKTSGHSHSVVLSSDEVLYPIRPVKTPRQSLCQVYTTAKHNMLAFIMFMEMSDR